MRISRETLQLLKSYNIDPAFDKIGNARFYLDESIFIIDEVGQYPLIQCVQVSLTSTKHLTFESVDALMNSIALAMSHLNGNYSYQD